MSMLRLRQLAGFAIPSFLDYVRSDSLKTGSEGDLTEEQWNALDSEYKGMYQGVKHYMVYESGALAILPIKTSFIGGITNDSVESPAPEVKDEVAADAPAPAAVGGDPEKAAKEIIASLRKGNKPAVTPDPESTLGDEPIKDGDLQDEKAADMEKVTEETVEEIAARLMVAEEQAEVELKQANAKEESPKVDVPSKILAQIDRRIKEIEAAMEHDDKGYNDGNGVKPNAIDVLTKMKEHLSMRNMEGVFQAKMLFSTLMSPITDLFPPALCAFIASICGPFDKE